MPSKTVRNAPKPSGTPTIQEFQQAARSNVAERTPGDLSEYEVQQVRAFRAAGARAISIAQQMRIDRRDVSKICKFKVRADVPRPFETDAQREWREVKHRQNEVEQRRRLEALSAKQAKKDAQAERKKQAQADKASRDRGEG